MPRRFLVAPDSFKGTFGAAEVARAIGAGLEAEGAIADLCPVADGGEGTAAVLAGALGGREVARAAHDPLRRPIEAGFVLLGGGSGKPRANLDTGAETVAVVEMARASGLPLIAAAERDPERADTYGTGELIAAAVAAGADRVLVAVGGSATTDGGRGAIEALRDAGLLPSHASHPLFQASPSAPTPPRLEVLCDVTTPFEDAARVFGPQKGADGAAVERLSVRLDAYAAELPRDPRGVPMTGAAGGLAGGLWAAFGATLRPGAAFVLDAINFDRRLSLADAVVTGEGRLDAGSFDGKAIGEIAGRCAAAGVPLHAIVGQDCLPGERVASIHEAGTLEEVTAAARRLARSNL